MLPLHRIFWHPRLTIYLRAQSHIRRAGPVRCQEESRDVHIAGYRRAFIRAIILLAVCISCPAPAQQSEIRDIITAGQLADMRWPSFADVQSALQKFYEPMGFASAWVTGSQPIPPALSLIAMFRDAEQKGLSPEDYDASRWDDRIHALNDSSNGMAVARFDVSLTVCAMRYVSALRVGRINPQHLRHQLSVEEKKVDLATFLRDQVLTSPNLKATLDGIEPPFPAYRRTEQALARYIELARRDDGEKLPAVKKTIEPGQPYSGVPRLARFLHLVGDLPQSASYPPDAEIYDAPLVDAVKRFQRRHGLDEDGRLGASTIKQLNVPLQDRVRQLQLTLERWRWLPTEFSAPPVIVNIPDFRLRALDAGNDAVFRMRVVVGRAMRTQTPVFSAEMTHVVFRPYWNVPRSILRNELLPLIQRDRGYLASKNYEVTTFDGRVVSTGQTSDEVLAQLQAGKLMVRQRPGPTNALGLVKLVFPNQNDVYLHDTPSTRLFARSRRDFSHGCIRVEKPAELAAWALRNNPGWTLERVQQAMQSGEDDVTVNLVKRVPVFIVYGTAFAYDNGDVDFLGDIYGFDARLAAALARGYPYP